MSVIDFTTVADDDTTYRSVGKSTADLKARALAMYFAPEEIRFLPKSPKNGKALALPYLTARAVMDRLDQVLSPENWFDKFESLPNGSVRCSLSVRFSSESEWLTKCDVGSPSEQPDEGDRDKAAHSDALKRAAVKFGVGRYLYSLPQVWADYDGQTRRFVNAPRLPQSVLPTAYRWADRARMKQIDGMLRAAMDGAKIPENKRREGTLRLFAFYGYKMEDKYPNTQNRHAQEIMQRLNDWIASIGKGVLCPPISPFYQAPATPTQPKPLPQSPTPPKEPPKDNPKNPNAGKLTKPVNGSELLARLVIKDDELAKANRIQPGALKAEIISRGARQGYSTDLCIWQGNMIDNALKWADEYIKALPESASAA